MENNGSRLSRFISCLIAIMMRAHYVVFVIAILNVRNIWTRRLIYIVLFLVLTMDLMKSKELAPVRSLVIRTFKAIVSVCYSIALSFAFVLAIAWESLNSFYLSFARWRYFTKLNLAITVLYAILFVKALDKTFLSMKYSHDDLGMMILLAVFFVLLLAAGFAKKYGLLLVIVLLGWWASFVALLASGARTDTVIFLVLSLLGIVAVHYIRKNKIDLPPFDIALTAVAAVLGFQLISFLHYSDPDEYLEIAKQPGVSIIFSTGEDQPVIKAVGKRQMRFVYPGCEPDVYYIGMSRPGGLLMYDAASDKSSLYQYYPLDDLLIDCAKRTLTFGTFNRKDFDVVEVGISRGRLTEKSRYKMPEGEHTTIFRDRRSKAIYLTNEKASLFGLLTEPNAKIISANLVGKMAAVCGDNIAVRIESGPILMLQPDFTAGKFIEKGKIEFSDSIERGQGHHICHPEKTMLYLNSYFTGELIAYDYRKHEQVGVVELAGGIRHIGLSPDNKYLLAAGNWRGELFIVDTEKLVLLKELNLGKRVRTITFSPDSRFAFVASSAGGFKIDLEQAVGP